ncbi:MAG: hypothetical protein IJO65_02100 [Lachnospiraceae bacterium]|nr:hypothetical protein [Lachnospiraceae bacterium]
MNRVLYEAQVHYGFTLITPFLFMIAIFIFAKLYKKDCEKRAIKINKKIYYALLLWIEFWLLAGGVVTVISQTKMYRAVVGAYKSGNYQILEGYVENFVPYSRNPYHPESFELAGVQFEYDIAVAIPGYHDSPPQGDIIKRNGQHLRIGYVNYHGDNIIVYIEDIATYERPDIALEYSDGKIVWESEIGK